MNALRLAFSSTFLSCIDQCSRSWSGAGCGHTQLFGGGRGATAGPNCRISTAFNCVGASVSKTHTMHTTLDLGEIDLGSSSCRGGCACCRLSAAACFVMRAKTPAALPFLLPQTKQRDLPHFTCTKRTGPGTNASSITSVAQWQCQCELMTFDLMV